METALCCAQWVSFAFRDYRPNEVLDAYEADGIDEAPEQQDITVEEQLEARARAERELNKRDRRENRHGLPGALEGKEGRQPDHQIHVLLFTIVALLQQCPYHATAESDSDESDRRPARRRRVEAAQADDMDEDEVCPYQHYIYLQPQHAQYLCDTKAFQLVCSSASCHDHCACYRL